jgi:flagellar biosynthesis/type III secretory pathway protein FliH
MDDVEPLKVKLTRGLTGVTEAAPAISQVRIPAAPAPAVSVPLVTSAVQNDLAELGRLAKEIQARKQMTAADVAQLSVELGVAIAERLVGAAINTDRQRLERIVLGVLDKMPAANAVTVRGHAGDIALLQRQLAGHKDWANYKELLKFRPDDSAQRGRFKIQAEDWFVEWDTQRCLKEMRAALFEETFTDK